MNTRFSTAGALRLWLLAMVVGWATSLSAQKEKSNSILWEVSSPGVKSKSYLLGTFHLIDKNFVIDHPAILTKASAAERVYTEVIMDSMEAFKLAFKAMTLDSPLTAFFSAVQLDNMAEMLYTTSENFDISSVYMFKPAVVEMLVINAIWKDTKYGKKYNSGEPMDVYIQQLAKKSGHQSVPLESMEWQFKLLLNDPLSTQAKSLQATMDEADDVEKMLVKTAKYYTTNDAKKLEKLLFSEENTDKIPDALLKDRNVKWVPTIAESMREKSTFVAVGAAHLYGPNGLVELLRKQGFTVKAIDIE